MKGSMLGKRTSSVMVISDALRPFASASALFGTEAHAHGMRRIRLLGSSSGRARPFACVCVHPARRTPRRGLRPLQQSPMVMSEHRYMHT